MVVRMRANRSKSGKRRSHHALSGARVSRCECGALRLNHRACSECGRYGGKVAIDIVARAARNARRAKRKQKELEASGRISPRDQEKEPVQT